MEQFILEQNTTQRKNTSHRIMQQNQSDSKQISYKKHASRALGRPHTLGFLVVKLLFISSLIFATMVSCVEKEELASAVDIRKNFLEDRLDWDQVEKFAKQEKEVNFYYWGGSKDINFWLDSVVAVDLKEMGIILNARRITNTREVVDLIISEVKSGKHIGEGSVDVVWINGDSFFTLSEQNMLFGSFADKLPNSKNFLWDIKDEQAKLNYFDFGHPTQKKEMPWGSAQFVYFVNRDVIPRGREPEGFNELSAYLKQNPGKFAYINPAHFLGSTFVSEVLYKLNPTGNGEEDFQNRLEKIGLEEFTKIIMPGFQYLRELKPLLYSQGTRYPENADALNSLFVNGEVDFGMDFGYLSPKLKIEDGIFPKKTEIIIFPKNGMIANKSYLAIPINAPNPAAALVMINYMSSVKSQLEKRDIGGHSVGIDYKVLSAEEKDLLNNTEGRIVGTTVAELKKHVVPDMNSSLVNPIRDIWKIYIQQNSQQAFEEIVANVYANYR